MNNAIKYKKLNHLLWLFLLLFNFSFSAYSQITPVGWLSLKYDKTYLRSGPSKQNKVLWTYKKKGLPIKVIRKKGDWYEVEMPERITGWISSTQISSKRRVLVISDELIDIRGKEQKTSKVIAKVGKNVVGELIGCQKTICKIDYYKIEGFVEKKFLWGVD
jgi:SH3-like domain-containing protein